jgi:hypothetical protein
MPRSRRVKIAIVATLVVILAVGFAPISAAGLGKGAVVEAVLPPGFAAQSLSWVSAKEGWALGAAACGNKTCTTVIGTADGGGMWSTVGVISAPIDARKPSGVTAIRFADGKDGWAFGPSLQETQNGGASWAPASIPGGQKQVLALVADAQVVYAVVSPCRVGRRCGQRATLWHTSPGSDTWVQVPVTLESAGVVSLALHGTVAYAAMQDFAPDPGAFFATTDGTDWSPRPNPCRVELSYTIADVAPISDKRVAILCVGDGGAGSAGKQVYRSDDTAQTTVSAGKPPLGGISALLAATSDGTLVVVSWSVADLIYRNTGGKRWHTVFEGGDGFGWSDPHFTTKKIGFVVHEPIAWGGAGEVWKTTDAGQRWHPIA